MDLFYILGDLDGLGNAIATLFFILLVFSIISYIIINLGLCFTFKKAGKPGYFAFIPIYNQVVLCDIAGVSRIWVVGLLFGAAIPVIGIAVVLYAKYLISFSVAKSFGKDNLFGFALFFLASIFYYIIGLDSSKYLGPTPVTDYIFNKTDVVNPDNGYNNENQVNQTDFSQSNVNQTISQGLFCANCGVKLNEGVSYCHNCGKRI